MQVGVLLFVISDVKSYLVAKSLLDTNGNFGTFTTDNDVELAVVVETSLKEHGVTVPDEIDKVMKVLPLVLQLAGIK